MLHLSGPRWVTVPAGFWSDGASIPSLARPLLSPLAMLAMGVAHDYAVRDGAVIESQAGAVPFTARSATDLAASMAARAGCGVIRCALIRAALFVAAPSYWRRRALDWRPS